MHAVNTLVSIGMFLRIREVTLGGKKACTNNSYFLKGSVLPDFSAPFLACMVRSTVGLYKNL